jgi:hypothetical protein
MITYLENAAYMFLYWWRNRWWYTKWNTSVDIICDPVSTSYAFSYMSILMSQKRCKSILECRRNRHWRNVSNAIHIVVVHSWFDTPMTSRFLEWCYEKTSILGHKIRTCNSPLQILSIIWGMRLEAYACYPIEHQVMVQKEGQFCRQMFQSCLYFPRFYIRITISSKPITTIHVYICQQQIFAACNWSNMPNVYCCLM